MATHTSTVTRKGQITIPVAIRRTLGIQFGDQVSIELDGTGLHMERRSPEETGNLLSGSLKVHAVSTHLTGQALIESEREAFTQAIVDDWVETECRMRPDYLLE